MKNYSEMTNAELQSELLARQIYSGDRKSTSSEPSVEELQRLIHDLQLHQIELEMQNRELREARRSLEDAHQQYATLYEFSPVAYLTLDRAGVIRELNLTAAKLLGAHRAYLLGLPFAVLVARHDTHRFWDHLRQCAQRGEKVVTKLDLKLKGGQLIAVQIETLTDATKSANDVLRTAIIEISERDQAETRNHASKIFQQSVLDSLTSHLAVLDKTGTITAVNDAWSQFACENGDPGMVRSGPGVNYLEVCRAAVDLAIEAQAVLTGLQSILAGEQSRFSLEYPCHSPTQERWFLLTAVSLRSEQGGAVVSHSDITVRRQAERALQANEARMAGILESAMDAIITVDAQQHIVMFNAAAEQMFLVPAAKAIGQSLDRFIPLRFRNAHSRHIANFERTYVTKRAMGALGAVYGLRSSGEEFPIEASISHIETQGQPFFTVILRDITQRKQVEDQLVEQAALLNHARDAILVRDLNDRILFWNQSAERIYGWLAEEVVGQDIKQLLYHGFTDQFEQAKWAVIEQGDWVGEMRQFTKSGREVSVENRLTIVRDSSGKPQSILSINTDVTEYRRLQSQFLRAQRLESIGTLASGIAHDLNNVLSPITMGIQLLQSKVSDESGRRLLEVIRQSAERGGELIKQVLSFARGAEGQKTTINPRHLISEITKVLDETFPKNISIHYSVPPDLGAICCSPTQLQQVLMNLCVNARDAMPEGGTLRLTAENIQFDQHYARMNPLARPDCYVMISVMDTGMGIPPALLDKIFDPFFTTKQMGQGTGLGLATVQGIVKSHDGFINVYSEPGHGTQFRIYLPAIISAQPAQTSPLHSDLPAGHGETVLVVDDEASISEITRSTLEAFGYRVLIAADGAEGVALYAAHQGEIRVVLTDMMMPLMDGPAMIRALRKINSQTPIIATSGLANDDRTAALQELGVEEFLPKPYNAERLLLLLDRLIRESQA